MPPALLRVVGDERLARLVTAGHDAAFAALYDRYRDVLVRYCRSVVRDEQDALDAFQSAMLNALRALREDRRHAPVRPWLFRIAHNEAISVLRRRPCRPRPEAPGPFRWCSPPDLAGLYHLLYGRPMPHVPRRSAAALVAAALAVAAAGCGSDNTTSTSTTKASGDSGKGAKIALLLPENKTARYEAQDKPRFIARVKELCPSCEVIYENANQDAAKQQQQAEAALTRGAKVIVLDAVDVASAGSIVTRAKQANVPVISYGRLVSNAPLDYYVSIDPFKVGQQQAQVLLDAMKQQGKPTPRVVMINGSPTDSNAPPYKKGAKSIFDQAGAKVVKSYDTPDWSPDKAQQEMEQAITAAGKGGFDAVYVANDGMAGGAIAAMKAAGIDPKKVLVTGQDAEATGVQRILAGEQLMTVYQPIPKIAATSADLAVPLAQGKQPPAITTGKTDNGSAQVPSVLLPTIAITKDNINDTVIKDGFLKPSDICTGEYKKDCAAAGIG